ncbi:transposase [Geobacillus stearothermophilus]|uniref:transposase n=1 Tax=Geobacillus stearothermophilus TaxID=1422 RepID=UPI0024026AD5|nr:transposase [Geobacillus stearothermophilus]MDF9298617.1 transposase [Geobacillus stearothermophilus]MED4302021.1 transposase [Geobacillus stearothermophilus]
MKKRTFDQEYKIQAVELCLEGDKSIAQVAKELGWLTTLFIVGSKNTKKAMEQAL